MVEFIFLGTGPSEAIPRPGHTDPICRDARKPRSRSRRLRSAGILLKGKTKILFDAGPDIGYQLTAHRIDDLDAVLITHAHLDAAGGLNVLNDWARQAGSEVPVYTERATRHRYGHFDNLPYRFVKPKEGVKINSAFVKFFRVGHSLRPGFPTLGFRVGNFAYASDVSSIPRSALVVLKDVEVLVLDAAFWFRTNYRGHLTPDKAVKYAQKLGVRRLFLTQTGHTYPPHNEAEQEIRRYAEERAPGMDVSLAYDGLKIAIK